MAARRDGAGQAESGASRNIFRDTDCVPKNSAAQRVATGLGEEFNRMKQSITV